MRKPLGDYHQRQADYVSSDDRLEVGPSLDHEANVAPFGLRIYPGELHSDVIRIAANSDVRFARFGCPVMIPVIQQDFTIVSDEICEVGLTHYDVRRTCILVAECCDAFVLIGTIQALDIPEKV